MISISKLKLFPYILRNQTLAIPNTDEKHYNLIIYPENMSFNEVYDKIQIKRIFIRKVILILSPFLKLFRNKSLIDGYRKKGLMVLPNLDNAKDNVYIDTSHIFEKLEQRYKPGNYRRKNIVMFINNFFNQFTENKERKNILLYCIDLHKDFDKNIFGKRFFPILYELYQNKDFKFDYVLLTVFKDNKPYYISLKNDTGVILFNRVRNLINSLKRIKDDVKPDDELNNAAESVTNEIDSGEDTPTLDKDDAKIIDKSEKDDSVNENKEKIKSAVATYLRDKPDVVEKIKSGNMTKGDAYAIATKAIIKNTSAASDKETNDTVDSIAKTDEEKKALLQKVTNNLVKDILKKKPSANNSTDIINKNISFNKINENKEPSHLLNKRYQDFSEVIIDDLKNTFKILEKKQPPLKLKSIHITPIEVVPGDLNPSLMSNYKATLLDEKKKEHIVEVQIPTIQEDGTFLINGRKKFLIFQLLLDPIFFLKKDIAKLESTYATLSIHLRETRHKSYFMIFISGCNLPLFALMGYHFGFEATCRIFKIAYKISNEKDSESMYQIKLSDDKYIDFKFDIRNRAAFLLLESIKQFPTMFNSTNYRDPHYYGELIIEMTKNRNSLYTINEVLQNILDPVSIQILKSRLQPTVLSDIFYYICTEMSKGRVDDRNDLNHQRIRTSEVFTQQIYNLMLQAYNSYRIKNISGDKTAKLFLDSRKVVQDILNSQLMREVENINPIEELSCLTRVTPVGPGGISDTNAVSNTSRDIHSSYEGNLDPFDTPENANVGVINQLTVDAAIASHRGLFLDQTHKNNRAGILSVNSAMIPFVNSTDGCRVMFSGSQGRQCIPIEGNEPPLVQTGYETILANNLSDCYVKKASDGGIITKVDNDIITIKLNTGRIQKVSLESKTLRSGQGQNSISIFKPMVKVGDRVKKDQFVAEGSLMKDGTISQGANILTAVMLWKGYSFEDGYIISENLANTKFASNSYHEIEILIKKDDNVSFLIDEGTETKTGEPLVIRSSREIEALINEDIDEIEEGRIITKSPGGKVISIEIYPNVSLKNYEVLQPQFNKFKQKYIKQHGNFPAKFKAQLYTSKNEEFAGILIKFKILLREVCELGDKITNSFGGKGVLALIEKEQNMPVTPFGERVELIINPIAIINRMNPSTLKEMYLGLIMKSYAKMMVKFGEVKNSKAIILTRQLFTTIDNTKDKLYSRQVIDSITNMNPKTYSFMIRDIVKRNYYFPVLIPPFQEPKLNQIYEAMKLVDVRPSYYLKLPEWNIKTQNPVSCGYIYYKKLEQQSGIKMSARSSGGMINMVTGQSFAGKKSSGGQRIGEMDSWSIINHGATNVLRELFGPLSDDLVTKNEIINEIIQNGSANYRDPKISPTRDMLKAYLQGLMIDTTLK